VPGPANGVKGGIRSGRFRLRIKGGEKSRKEDTDDDQSAGKFFHYGDLIAGKRN